MALVTIQRSPDSVDLSDSEVGSDTESHSEDYFVSMGVAVLQNKYGRRSSTYIPEEDIILNALRKTLGILRKSDTLHMIVELEKINSDAAGNRYLSLISTFEITTNREEYAMIGLDFVEGKISIGIVIPIYCNVSVVLDGDVGFKVSTSNGDRLFKSRSVHSLWTTVHLLNRACECAQASNIYHGGLNHTWISYYENQIKSTRAQIAEWNKKIHTDIVKNSELAPKSAVGELVSGNVVNEETQNKDVIRETLKAIMQKEDPEVVTVLTLRTKLQELVDFEVQQYKEFIAEESMIICGQMDESTEILPHLYLGSTYNASNLEELQQNKITHIINVTEETENFFPDQFQYKNVEVVDKDKIELRVFFDPCHKFINEALDKPGGGVCLVHCQRGISRSATIVISYVMKEKNMNFNEAYEFVKSKRDCVRPNDGFIKQLQLYDGIIQASANRNVFKDGEKMAVKSDSWQTKNAEVLNDISPTRNQLDSEIPIDDDDDDGDDDDDCLTVNALVRSQSDRSPRHLPTNDEDIEIDILLREYPARGDVRKCYIKSDSSWIRQSANEINSNSNVMQSASDDENLEFTNQRDVYSVASE